jgi:hypothetical protein
LHGDLAKEAGALQKELAFDENQAGMDSFLTWIIVSLSLAGKEKVFIVGDGMDTHTRQ